MHTVTNALNSLLRPVIIVLGFQAWALKKALTPVLTQEGIQILVNPDWMEGKASSIKLALQTLPTDVKGCVFLPGDMPLISPVMIRRVGETLLSTNRIVFPGSLKDVGHPVAFPARFFHSLIALSEDEGGRKVIMQNLSDVFLIPAEKEAFFDLDTLKDYQDLITGEEGQSARF